MCVCITYSFSILTHTHTHAAIIRATNPHDGQTALHRAVHSDRLDNVALLLKSDPECQLAGDGRGDTPLHMACRVTQRKVQRRIVESLLVSSRSHTPVIPYCHISIPESMISQTS